MNSIIFSYAGHNQKLFVELLKFISNNMAIDNDVNDKVDDNQVN